MKGEVGVDPQTGRRLWVTISSSDIALSTMESHRRFLWREEMESKLYFKILLLLLCREWIKEGGME